MIDKEPDFDQVAQFIASECGVPRARIRPDARIERDLGVTGDDASELMSAFARTFAVDLTGFECHRHFGPEGGFPGLGLYWRLRHDYTLAGDQVTVAELLNAARAGRWSR